MEKLTFENDKSGKIADILCKKGFSYNHVCKILRNKDVKIDDVRTKENVFVEKGQKITVFYEKIEEKLPFDVIYEDENIFVLNKKAGVEVEGASGLEGLSGGLAVHRLDRNTAGLLIMAKNKKAQQQLLNAFKNHAISKKYLAEVVGKTSFKGKIYTAYLQKDSQNSLVKIYPNPSKNRDEIKTGFTTLKSGNQSSIVLCDLITGKTHQIRAHLAYLGHPIIGDGKYGRNEDNKKFKKKTQQLFCCSIVLNGLSGDLEYLNGKEFALLPDWAKILKNQ